MSSTHSFDAASGTRRHRRRWLWHLSLTGLIGATVFGLGGCGPLGLYTLLQHNHVFKPVLPDDEPTLSDAGPPAEAATEKRGETISSSDRQMPMEITHSPPVEADSVAPDADVGD